MPRRAEAARPSPVPDIIAEFRRGLQEEMERRWLTSSLAEWMTAQHAVAAEMLRDPAMNWSKAAEAFGGVGLRDRDGRPPTAETARETWRRVEDRRRNGMKHRMQP